MDAAGITNKGITRSQNQDAIFVCKEKIGPFPNLFIVADGMGGHNAGDIASSTAIDDFSAYVKNFAAQEFITPVDYLNVLTGAVKHAGDEIAKKAKEDPSMEGMGTTITACVISDKKAYIVHVGDSRAYAVNPDKIMMLTSDHTLADELLRQGKITEEEAKNHPRKHVLTRALGVPDCYTPDEYVKDISEYVTLLMCSDGLTNMVDDETMMRFTNGLGTAEHRAQYLVDEANKNGGKDNISVILIDFQ